MLVSKSLMLSQHVKPRGDVDVCTCRRGRVPLAYSTQIADRNDPKVKSIRERNMLCMTRRRTQYPTFMHTGDH